MSAPTVVCKINDNRGAMRHGLNVARITAVSAGTDNFSSTALIDISSHFNAAPYPLGLKIHRIMGSVDGSMTGLNIMFKRNTNETIVYPVTPNMPFNYKFKPPIKDTFSELLDNCDSAWTAASNVSQADETTIVIPGSSKSRALTIDDAFTTGIIAYLSGYGAVDMSDYDSISFYIRSSVDLQPGDISIATDESVSIGSPSDELPIPIALKKDQWNYITIDFTSTTGNRDAIISHGLKANRDFGAAIIYIDEIRYKKKSEFFDGIGSGRSTIGANGDIICTSTGIANLDALSLYIAYEYCWHGDNVR